MVLLRSTGPICLASVFYPDLSGHSSFVKPAVDFIPQMPLLNIFLVLSPLGCSCCQQRMTEGFDMSITQHFHLKSLTQAADVMCPQTFTLMLFPIKCDGKNVNSF